MADEIKTPPKFDGLNFMIELLPAQKYRISELRMKSASYSTLPQ